MHQERITLNIPMMSEKFSKNYGTTSLLQFEILWVFQVTFTHVQLRQKREKLYQNSVRRLVAQTKLEKLKEGNGLKTLLIGGTCFTMVISHLITRKSHDMEDIKEKIINEAKRVEEDSLYSAKGHFEAANRWINVYFWIGIPTACLAAIAGASALSQFDYHNTIAGFLSIIVAAFTAITTFLNPNERATFHKNAGNMYNSLRNRARIFYQIECGGTKADEELIDRLRELTDLRDELNQNSPQIPRWAYEKAKRGIKAGEADYKVDEN